jgi:hypothetical protein
MRIGEIFNPVELEKRSSSSFANAEDQLADSSDLEYSVRLAEYRAGALLLLNP